MEVKDYFKKGISKEYELEKNILNSETIGEIYDKYFVDTFIKRINFSSKRNEIFSLTINEEKINITDKKNIGKEKIIETFKKYGFLDINLITYDYFFQNFHWFFKENDIFVNDVIRKMFKKFDINYSNGYSYVIQLSNEKNLNTFNYEKKFNELYLIKDNKVFKKSGMKYDYFKIDNSEKLKFFIENFFILSFKIELKEIIPYQERLEILKCLSPDEKKDFNLRYKAYFNYLENTKIKFQINFRDYIFVGYDKFIKYILEIFEKDNYIKFGDIYIKKNDYLIYLYENEKNSVLTIISEKLFNKIQGNKVENDFEEENRMSCFNTILSGR